jgi:2-methylcitrate dehydratase PrpD
MRLCEFGQPGIREYGWHHATLTSIAAPIAAGRMLDLSPGQIQQAIGISCSPSMCLGAVTAGKLTNMKNTVDPLATRSGVQAALLAARGYSGPEHSIDGKESLKVRRQIRPEDADRGLARFASRPLPHPRLRNEVIPDRSPLARAALRHDENRP